MIEALQSSYNLEGPALEYAGPFSTYGTYWELQPIIQNRSPFSELFSRQGKNRKDR